MSGSRGIYVEILIQDEMEHIWRLTQDPALHQRWDLRFSRIEYLARPDCAEPQKFLYETRIGFGLSIRGTGESAGEHEAGNADATSALKFASPDPKSLIREGSGYWRYIVTPAGLRFLTWYDYSVRFGVVGRGIDRLMFRPLIVWATAWSFDRLRLWAEEGQTPEASAALATINAIARLAIAGVWLWHGLVPKLLYQNVDERAMLGQAGIPLSFLPWIGGLEIGIGLLVLCAWRWRAVYVANAVLMILALSAVAVTSSSYLKAAFNPVSLNLALVALSIIGWIACGKVPSSRHCRRSAPKELG